MARTISQRQLRNESGEIMLPVDRGESFVVTRNGVPVADLVPHRRARFVDSGEVVAGFAALPTLDRRRFRRDMDRVLDQDPRPRA